MTTAPSSWFQEARQFFKRKLKDPDDVDTFMVSEFKKSGSLGFPFTRVFDRSTGRFNSAEFRSPLINDVSPKFEIGVEGLCGCTILVVVSREAVWFAHFL